MFGGLEEIFDKWAAGEERRVAEQRRAEALHAAIKHHRGSGALVNTIFATADCFEEYIIKGPRR